MSRKKIKTIYGYVKSKSNVLIIFMLIFVISVLFMLRYVSFYEHAYHYFYVDHKKVIMPYSSFEGPHFEGIDYLILFLSGIIAGLVLREFEDVLINLAKAALLSFLTIVVYASFYIWFILNFREFGITNPSAAFEWTIFFAILNVARMLPIGLVPCFAGAVIACFLAGTL